MGTTIQNALLWTMRLIVAGVLGQTLFFKFSGAPESVFIFSALGVEPWGRISAGAMEAVALLLVLWPRTSVPGALLTCGLMVGAIGSHFFVLGIIVQQDGGLLFGLAVTTLALSLGILWMLRSSLPEWIEKLPFRRKHAS